MDMTKDEYEALGAGLIVVGVFLLFRLWGLF